MKINLFLPLFLFALAAICVGQTYPFLDQNQITDIRAEGHKIFFTTTNGEKSLNLATGQWQYKVAPSNPRLENKTENPQYPLTGNGLNGNVEAVDNIKRPTWELSLLGEVVWSGHCLSTLDYKRSYSFCYGEPLAFTRILIRQNKAWLGGKGGILSIELDTGKMTHFYTYPLFPILNAVQVDGKIYYVNERGLFAVEKGAVSLVLAQDKLLCDRFLDLFLDDDKIYLLYFSNERADSPADQSKLRFAVFDPGRNSFKSFVAPVQYANHLAKVNGAIIAYGANRMEGEGGEECNNGGAFTFSLAEEGLKKLTDLPICYFDPNGLKAESVVMGEDGEVITVTHFQYLPDKGIFKLLGQEGFTENKQEDFYQVENNDWGPGSCYTEKNHLRYYYRPKQWGKWGHFIHDADNPEPEQVAPAKKELLESQVEYQTLSEDVGTAVLPKPTCVPLTPTPTPKIGTVEKWLYH